MLQKQKKENENETGRRLNVPHRCFVDTIKSQKMFRIRLNIRKYTDIEIYGNLSCGSNQNKYTPSSIPVYYNSSTIDLVHTNRNYEVQLCRETSVLVKILSN